MKRVIQVLLIVFSLFNICFGNLSTSNLLLQTKEAVCQADSSCHGDVKFDNKDNISLIREDKVSDVKAPKSETSIGKLAKNGYALVYFFDSTCPHCKNFSPIVKAVADDYGFHVFDFSFNQQGLPSFPKPAPVNQSIYQAYYGHARAFYPVLILQNVNDMSFYIVAKGELPKTSLLQVLDQYAKELV
ncbi:conjugal transfer protein TraF [Thiotrichales bacterium 19S11-10]|nr:conjugal transfer protein TraF [Thiotrichales bacterium 19S11-10]